MITRSRTLQLAAANDGSSLPQSDNEKSKRKAAGRKRDDQSKNLTWKDYVTVLGVHQNPIPSSKPSCFTPCCVRKYSEQEHQASQHCICRAFESCINLDNFRRDDGRKIKPAYFLQTSDNGYICLSCHHRTGCQIYRDDCEEENQLNLQAAGRHLADGLCGRRKKKEEGMTANIFLFKWDGRGNLLVSKQFMNFGGRFDYVKFLVTSAASLIEALSKKWPEEYKGAVPLAISRLSRVVIATDTDLQDDPQWLCVKLLRLLQNYPSPDDPSDKDRLLECLEGILNKVQDAPKSKKVQHSNAKNAVLFEAIALIIHMDSESQLLVRACNQLGTFLSHRETSMRYRALESMCLLATSEFLHDAIKKHQDTIINSLKTERDVSVGQRAVDLLYAMCDRSNANQIVAEMLAYLETADNSVKEEMVLKVSLLAEKYATDYTWYVDVILKLIRIAGDYVSEQTWYCNLQIVVNREDVQEYAAKTVFEALQRPACHENMVKVGGYILGEFGNFIAGDERSTAKIQFELLHSKFHLCSITTRCLLLTTYIKFCNLFPEIKPLVQQVFQTDNNLKSPDAELQKQSFEYLQMTKLVEDLLATVRTVKVEVEEGDDGSQDVMPAARTALLAAFQKLAADLRLPIDADKLNRKMVLEYKIFKIVEVTSILEKSIKIIQNSDNVDPGTHFDPLDCVKLHVFFLLLQTNFKDRNLNDFQSIRDTLQKAVEASEDSDKWISLSTITPCLEKIIDTLIAETGLACVL